MKASGPWQSTARTEATDPRVRLVRDVLLNWWTLNRRVFPWREDTDPYRVLIAELMLRRTRADQVAAVYLRFVGSYPDAAALAGANADEVCALLQPLGLRWRARNVAALIGILASAGPSVLAPDRIDELPGVGAYVAAAVRCFAYGQAVPIVDANTSRVVTRVFGLTPGREPRRSRIVGRLLADLVDTGRPRDFNLALLDFAALVCRAIRPRCRECPMVGFCEHARASACAPGVPAELRTEGFEDAGTAG